MAVLAPPPWSPEDHDLQALIEEARRRARRRRRRGGAVAVALGLLAAGVVYLLVGHGAGRAARSMPAGRAGAAGALTLRPGQLWYMRAVSSLHQWMPAGGTTFDRQGYAHRHGPEVLFDVRLTEETWVAVDGSMRDRITALPSFATAAGRATWAAHGRPVPNFNGWLAHDAITFGGGRFPPQLWYPWGEGLGPYGLHLGDSLLSYRELRSLPVQTNALVAALNQAETALARRDGRTGDNTGDQSLPDPVAELTDVAGLLASPVPAAERLELLRAASALPGVTVNRHARDALGRHGFSITATAGIAMQRLIFDPATGALLAGPKGTILSQGAVNSLYTLPRGTAPVRSSGAPAVPASLAITPRVGGVRTTFRLTLTRAGTRGTPTLDWILAGSAGERCFPRSFPRPMHASAVARGAFTYVLGPSQVGHRSWCPGRYELQVVPDYAPRSARGWQPGMPGPTFSSGIGTASYFEVK